MDCAQNIPWDSNHTAAARSTRTKEAAFSSKLIVYLNIYCSSNESVSWRQGLTHPALTLWQRSSQKHLSPRNCVRVCIKSLCCGSNIPRSTVLKVTCVRVCRYCPLKTSKEVFQREQRGQIELIRRALWQKKPKAHQRHRNNSKECETQNPHSETWRRHWNT